MVHHPTMNQINYFRHSSALIDCVRYCLGISGIVNLLSKKIWLQDPPYQTEKCTGVLFTKGLEQLTH